MQQLDFVFDLLSKERRRYALYYLEQAEGPVSISELEETVLEWESGHSQPEMASRDEPELAIELHHRDIPKITEAEYIEYDPEAEEIAIGGVPTEVKVILSVTEAIEQPRQDDVITF